MNKKPWVHFVAICGPTVGAVAVFYKKKGWKVTGSDVSYYPPASDYLKENRIEILNGFDGKRITKNMDLVILGGGAMIMDRDNPEVKKAQELGIKVLSWPQIAGEIIAKKESVVIAGTYGKTTTTSMIAWILKDQGKDPSYLIGGFANNFSDNVYVGKSDVSVMEGDEHPAAFHFDDKSKFLYYKPRYVLITSAKWDHFNVFPKESDYVGAFVKLVKLLPKNGVLFLSKDGENLRIITKYAKCKVVWYSMSDFKGKLRLMGDFNKENAAGATVVSRELGISEEGILNSLSEYKGVKRRLEKRFENEKTLIVEDFAQHPYKVKEVIKTLKVIYPKRKLLVVFDPFASILRDRKSLGFYKDSFSLADGVIVRRVKVATNKNKRVTGPDIVGAMHLPKANAKYVPLDENIVREVENFIDSDNTVLLFCSSGGWNGLIKKITKRIS